MTNDDFRHRFIRDYLIDPADGFATLHVWADWLISRGDPLGEILQSMVPGPESNPDDLYIRWHRREGVHLVIHGRYNGVYLTDQPPTPDWWEYHRTSSHRTLLLRLSTWGE